jgi:hypothetical protein
VYVVYASSKPGTDADTGNTFGSVKSGVGSQSAAYFVRYDGATGATTTPQLIDAQGLGHQVFPDITADAGNLFVVWWDSRQDAANYTASRPVGNNAAGVTFPSVDAYSAKSTNGGASFTNKTRLTTITSNPNLRQFANRTVPFAGDYLWITSVGSQAFAVWTDWRDAVAGTDPRTPADASNSVVKQCRVQDPATGVWGADQCPRDGGLDQNIYGAILP